MKTIIALCLIGYAIAAQGEPLATSYCMGNTEGNANCSQCYNYGLGTIGPRYISSNLCANKLTTLVTDCLEYNPTKNANTLAFSDCINCNSKTWLNVDATSGSIAAACSATAPSGASGSGQMCAAVVQNCAQNVCHKDGATYTKICARCNATYRGTSGLSVSKTMGYATCEASTSGPISGCSIYDPVDRTKCHLCDSGKSVKFAGTLCETFSGDTNCRQLATGDQYCGICKTNYYFTLKVCTLGHTASSTATAANLMAFGAMLMALLAFFN